LDESAHASLAASCEELRARTGNPPLAEKIKADVYVNQDKSLSDLQTLIKHSFLLYFPRELLMNFLSYDKVYQRTYSWNRAAYIVIALYRSK
jgi:hypothetical protein